MIQQLKISNFQCHEKLVIDFDPFVTCILGRSDAGKSAILRALRFVCLNRPNGDSFIQHGAENTKLVLTVDNQIIKRKRGKAGNTYHLNGQEYKNFKDGIPQDITKLLNVSDITFQGQHDSPFWFGLSSGEVSRQLNQIINPGVIDSTLAHINGLIRENTSRIAINKERLTKAKDERNRLKPIKEVDQALQEVEKLSLILGETRLEASRIDDLLSDGGKYRSIVKNAGELQSDGLAVVETGDRLAKLMKKKDGIQILYSRIWHLTPTATRKVPDISSLEKLGGELKELKSQRDGLRELLVEADRLQNAKVENKAQAAYMQLELEKEIGNKCPLCDSIVKHDHH